MSKSHQQAQLERYSGRWVTTKTRSATGLNTAQARQTLSITPNTMHLAIGKMRRPWMRSSGGPGAIVTQIQHCNGTGARRAADVGMTRPSGDGSAKIASGLTVIFRTSRGMG